MSVYLDTSVLVSLFVRDEMTDIAHSHLSKHPGVVTVSDWTMAEAASALSRAVRTGGLQREDAGRAIGAMDLWINRAGRRVEVLPADIREAEFIIRGFETTLKAPDAVHVVIARRAELALLSFDKGMARAAAALGVALSAAP